MTAPGSAVPQGARSQGTPSQGTSSPLRVAVVGGGIAGLAAAHQLCTLGVAVEVWDAGALGGKLRTSTFAGRPVDEGPDTFLARVPWATELAEAVGLGQQLVAPRTTAARVFVDGRLQPLPAAHVMGIPCDPDAADIAELLGPDGVADLRRDLANPGSGPDGDETLGAFIRRRLGPAVLDRLVAPLVGGINAADLDRASLAATTPQLDALARGAAGSLVRAAAAAHPGAPAPGTTPPPLFLAPRGGMGGFVAALVDNLASRGVHLHPHTAVRALEPRRGGGWRVVTDPTRGGVATDSSGPTDVDAVVVAAPAPVASALLSDHAPTAGELLGGIRWASVVLTTLAVAPDDIPDLPAGSGFLVPPTAGLLLTACSWSSSKWADLAPEHGDGTLLLRASAGRDGDRRISELDDEALVASLLDDLGVTSGLRGEPRATRVSRWPSSLPQYDVGHLARVDAIEADLAAQPTLAVAGSALRGVGIPASIRSGQLAAQRVLEALQS